jgi:hypothetical protein
MANHPNRSKRKKASPMYQDLEFEMRLRSAQAVPTKANTPFMKWWEKLNIVLASKNLADALYGDARDYYQTGHSPETAAQDIAVVRWQDEP